MKNVLLAMCVLVSQSAMCASLNCDFMGQSHDGKSFSGGVETAPKIYGNGAVVGSNVGFDSVKGDYSFHVAAQVADTSGSLKIVHMEITDLNSRQASKIINSENKSAQLSLFSSSGDISAPYASAICYIK